MVTIRKQLIPDTTMKFAGTNPKLFLTIHETGNTSHGANAAAHANLQSRMWDWATWHWTVDAREAVQSYSHDYRLWHAGDGNGNGNMSSIGMEVCVNSDMDRAKARDNAAQLAAIILKQHNIPISNMVQHNHWSGKNCPTFIRGEGRWGEFINLVKKYMGQSPNPTPSPSPAPSGTISQLADRVLRGDFGNGAARQAALGSNYAVVQAEVNRRLNGGGSPAPAPSAPNINALAKAVIRGDYGNGAERQRRLGANYSAVQAEVNRILSGGQASSAPNINALAKAVIRGDYGNGAERQRRLGSLYNAVQAEVNRIL